MLIWYRQSSCSFYYESRALHFGSVIAPLNLNGEHDNRIRKLEGANIFQNLHYFQVVKIDFAERTSGMVAALDLCLTFVECDSTAKVHELQEVNHDCVKCREMASGTFSVVRIVYTWP